MGNSSIMGLDLKIDEKYIGEVVKNVVQASVVEALGAKDDLVKSAISTILGTKVDKDGKKSSYASDNKYTLLEFHVNRVVTELCKELAKEMLEENREAIKKELRKQLSSTRSIEAFTRSMIDGTIENLDNRWSPSIKVSFNDKERY